MAFTICEITFPHVFGYLFTCPLKLLCPIQCYHPANAECLLIQVKVNGIQSTGRKVRRVSFFTVKGEEKEKEKKRTDANINVSW